MDLPIEETGERKMQKEQRKLLLYRHIKHGDFESDAEAARHFYESTPNDERYKSLKYRLKQKLLNHLYFIEERGSKLSPSNLYELRCLDLLQKAKSLIYQGERKTSEKLLKNCLKTAEEYEFTYITILVKEVLMLIYNLTGKYKAFYTIKEDIRSLYKKQKAESEATDLFFTSKMELSRSLNSRKKHLDRVPYVLKKLKKLWDEHKSFAIYDFYYKLNITYLEMIGDFNSIISTIKETDVLLEDGQINKKSFDHRYHMFINVYAHLRNKSLEDGLKLAETFSPFFSNISQNSMVFMENYFLLAMHARQYEKARKVLGQAYENMVQIKLAAKARERWALYAAYLYYVLPDEKLKNTFDYNIFFVDTPNYRKDKQGFNIAVIILQFLFYLKRNDIESLFYRADSLRKYAGKHLRDNVSVRNKMFFKLLIMVVDKDMDVPVIRRKGWYTYNKLKSTTVPGDAYSEIEIIPYEHLWEMILKEIGGADALEEWKERG